MYKKTGYIRCSNTAHCFAHFGFFIIKLDVNISVLVPRCKGLSRVGNLVCVPLGEIKKTLQPEFFVTVADGMRFTIPAAAVIEIRDENNEIICARITL